MLTFTHVVKLAHGKITLAYDTIRKLGSFKHLCYQPSAMVTTKRRRCFSPSAPTRGVRGMTPDGVCRVLLKPTGIIGFEIDGCRLHTLQATIATRALEHAEIAKVQQWLGHANISTRRVCDRHQSRAKDICLLPCSPIVSSYRKKNRPATKTP
jgi:integrase